MKNLVLAAVALSAVLFATGTTIADTHLTPQRETYSRIPGHSATPFLRVAAQDYECIERACKALGDQCRASNDRTVCARYGECMQSARETGQCDN